MPSKLPLFGQIETWLNEVNGHSKSAAATKDPGGYTGPTSHPIKDVDNRTQEATEGFRSKENTQDNKEDRGVASVDSTSPGSGGDQESHQMQIGTHKSETGNDPSVEDDYKSEKEDGNTTHPADAESLGEKYSSLAQKGDLVQLLKLHKQASDTLLAKITVSVNDPSKGTPSQKKAGQQKTATKTETKTQETQSVAEAGYELATTLGYQTKESADQAAEQLFAAIIKEASDDADRVGPFLLSYLAERQKAEAKKAAEGGGEAELPPEEAAPAEEGAGAPPPEMPPGGGGMPPDAMGGGGGGEGGGMGQDAALQELAMALMELGISPEQLAQAAAGAGGAGGGGGMDGGMGGAMPPMPPEGGGGMPPGGGAMPPPPEAGGSPADMGAKIASAVLEFKRSGRFEVRPAKTAAERSYRNEMKNYIKEIVGTR